LSRCSAFEIAIRHRRGPVVAMSAENGILAYQTISGGVIEFADLYSLVGVVNFSFRTIASPVTGDSTKAPRTQDYHKQGARELSFGRGAATSNSPGG